MHLKDLTLDLVYQTCHSGRSGSGLRASQGDGHSNIAMLSS